MTNRAGQFVRQQGGIKGFSAFIPAPLPPDPPVDLGGDMARLPESAAYALGRLGGASIRLDPDRLLYIYVRKEAVLTSQIEGTQSTLTDLLRYENANAPGTPVDDVREVAHCVDALFYAADQMKAGPLPLSSRLSRVDDSSLASFSLPMVPSLIRSSTSASTSSRTARTTTRRFSEFGPMVTRRDGCGSS